MDIGDAVCEGERSGLKIVFFVPYCLLKWGFLPRRVRLRQLNELYWENMGLFMTDESFNGFAITAGPTYNHIDLKSPHQECRLSRPIGNRSLTYTRSVQRKAVRRKKERCWIRD